MVAYHYDCEPPFQSLLGCFQIKNLEEEIKEKLNFQSLLGCFIILKWSVALIASYLSIPFGMLHSSHLPGPEFKMKLSIPFGMLLNVNSFLKEAYKYTFNPFWDASRTSGDGAGALTVVTFNPFWDASEESEKMDEEGNITFNPFWDASK